MFKDSLSSFSVFIGLLLMLATLVLVGASQGALKITFASLQDAQYLDIWLNIRLPRVLLAVLVGGALATAGVRHCCK
ncbi:iron-hydroxamate transporter permease subunit [Kluyvera intermedia]|nr:iron chelate uptake ABC transporter family permease subunit [Kluyvera intermedia]VDZ82042.1 iron-hydroxamate transporter permease subunit [Kluyvera intermedia]